jgi:hypothetical protein
LHQIEFSEKKDAYFFPSYPDGSKGLRKNRVNTMSAGWAGVPLYTPDPVQPNIVTASKNFHFLRISIEASTLFCPAVTMDGAEIDNFSVQIAN